MAKWTEAQKLQALAIAEASSVKEASQKTGIPEPTLRRLMAGRKKKNDHHDRGHVDQKDQFDQNDHLDSRLSGLTRQQRLFVNEYLVDLNATKAAIRAGYSAKNADKIGPELLGKTRVAAAIEHAMKERELRTQISADSVVRELAHIAFDDIKNYLRFYSDENGNIKMEVKDSEIIDTRSISEVSLGKDGQFRFKMYCKDNALVQLGKHLGIFNERINVDMNVKDEAGDTRDKLIGDLRASIAEVRAAVGIKPNGSAAERRDISAPSVTH